MTQEIKESIIILNNNVNAIGFVIIGIGFIQFLQLIILTNINNSLKELSYTIFS